jgi:centrosomal protein CEP76
MSNQQLFNLEKIKQLTNPIEQLQTELNQLNIIYSKISNNTKDFKNELADEHLLSQIEFVEDILQEISKKLISLSKSNLNKFLNLQDNLIKKYKKTFKNNLKELNIDEDTTKKIGLFLIEKKSICKIIDYVSYIPSIEINQWLELLDSLKHNTLFVKSVKKTKTYYQQIIQIRFQNELRKIPKNTDSELIEEFKKAFIENPDLTFGEFLKFIENQLSKEELKAKREFIEKLKEKEEFEKLKKKQEQQKELFEEYLKLSDKEFERLRRKKRREKLPKSKKKSQEEPAIEISNEVSEKIKKFKSKLEKGFKEDYMVQKDDNIDPLDLIRERKKKKEKEYKYYKDHFDNN